MPIANQGLELDGRTNVFATREDRFWAKVDIGEPDECWPWLGGVTSAGYGQFFWGAKRNVSAHRASYTFYYGEPATGVVIDHLCHTKLCCNPTHLRYAAQSDNIINQVFYEKATDTWCFVTKLHFSTEDEAKTTVKQVRKLGIQHV